MSRKNYQPEAVIDFTGHGFRVPLFGSPGPMLRNLAIVGVSFCWDLEDAQFFNPASLVVPCRAGDGLRRLLTRASHREYSKIVGHGQFAKPEHVLKSMEGAGTQRKWMTCYFERSEFCFYFDDAAAWTAHEQAEIADLTPAHFLEMAEFERQLQRRQRLDSALSVDDFAPALPALPTPAELEERRQKAIAERLADLREHRRQALEQDRQLGAWLRGELPAPPLLRSVA